MYQNDELYHFGVKGMKWGHRKKEDTRSDVRKRYDSAKAEYKLARKAYGKSYNSAYNYTQAHPISQFTNKKRSAEADRRWTDTINKADASNKARAEYKKIKQEYKQTDEYKAKRNRAIKVGVAAVGATLAAYGTYKVSKYIKNRGAVIVDGQRFANARQAARFNMYMDAFNGESGAISRMMDSLR